MLDVNGASGYAIPSDDPFRSRRPVANARISARAKVNAAPRGTTDLGDK